MQSAWSRVRERLPLAEGPTLLLVLALSIVIAQSTVIMLWVDHDSERFVASTVLAVIAMSVLAVIRPFPALVALLFGSSYRASLLGALKSGLRLTSDSRWDFWETGVAATAGVMLLAIFVPPLTHDDQTVNVENGVFRSWAEFQQNLNHPVEVGRGGSAAFSTGFATDAGLNGPLRRSDKLVFVYTITGEYAGPRYLRGVNLQNGIRQNQWAYLNNPFGFQFFVSKNSNLPYADNSLHEQFSSTVQVHMLRPPSNAPDILFYPGQ